MRSTPSTPSLAELVGPETLSDREKARLRGRWAEVAAIFGVAFEVDVVLRA
jgi:hypothetical protein